MGKSQLGPPKERKGLAASNFGTDKRQCGKRVKFAVKIKGGFPGRNGGSFSEKGKK